MNNHTAKYLLAYVLRKSASFYSTDELSHNSTKPAATSPKYTTTPKSDHVAKPTNSLKPSQMLGGGYVPNNDGLAPQSDTYPLSNVPPAILQYIFSGNPLAAPFYNRYKAFMERRGTWPKYTPDYPRYFY